ncbi:MAG: HAD-IIIA family hydrolase [Chloroflexi bacterium]|nr:HAD-IIIA family hydrolase [Chloroflexota bacterium]
MTESHNRPKTPYLLIDRDGTVIVDKHYLDDPAAVDLITGAAEGLRRIIAMGFGIVIVTNQSGVGRGYFKREQVDAVHQRLLGMLATAQAEGTEPLAEVIRRMRSQLGASSSVIIITPSPEPSWVQALDVLVSGRTQTAVVLLDASSFGGTGDTALVRAHLQSKGAITYVVGRGQDLSEALDYRGTIPEPVIMAEVSQPA